MNVIKIVLQMNYDLEIQTQEQTSKYSRAPFSARIRWMNAVAQIKFALIEQSNQYEKNYLVQ